jgi:rhodanese-related sulfurtransferase
VTLDERLHATHDPQMAVERQTLDQLLDSARARIRRYEPAEARAAVEGGALLIDIRSDFDRARDGIVPGSLHIPRTVLEWRLEPNSTSRNPYVGGLEREIILICDHGCSSILAADTLLELGFTRTGDVVGGFAAWSQAGLPTIAYRVPSHQPGEPAGMRGPEVF